MKVEPSGWSKGHANLISEESVGDVGWRVMVDEDHYYAADHLPNLMVDETLTDYVKNQEVFSQLLYPKAHYIPLSLRVLRSQIF